MKSLFFLFPTAVSIKVHPGGVNCYKQAYSSLGECSSQTGQRQVVGLGAEQNIQSAAVVKIEQSSDELHEQLLSDDENCHANEIFDETNEDYQLSSGEASEEDSEKCSVDEKRLMHKEHFLQSIRAGENRAKSEAIEKSLRRHDMHARREKRERIKCVLCFLACFRACCWVHGNYKSKNK